MASDFAFSDYTPKMIFSYVSETAIIHFLTPECHMNKMIPHMFPSLLMSTTFGLAHRLQGLPQMSLFAAIILFVFSSLQLHK